MGFIKRQFSHPDECDTARIDLEEVQRSLEAIDGILEIHDLHVWNPSNESIALAVHITVPDQMLGSVDELAGKVRKTLADEFHIDHPTLQFECVSCNHGQLLCCTPENDHPDHQHH